MVPILAAHRPTIAIPEQSTQKGIVHIRPDQYQNLKGGAGPGMFDGLIEGLIVAGVVIGLAAGVIGFAFATSMTQGLPYAYSLRPEYQLPLFVGGMSAALLLILLALSNRRFFS